MHGSLMGSPPKPRSAALLVLSCSTLGSKSLTHGSGQALFEWKRRLIQEQVGPPWSTEELNTSAEHRTYLNFFARLCLVKFVMRDRAAHVADQLWQLLDERTMRGPLWRLPDRVTMQRGINHLGSPNVFDLNTLVESTGMAFARLSEGRSATHGTNIDRSKVARLAMQAFVLGELLPLIRGSATLGCTGASAQLRLEYDVRRGLA